MNARVAPVMDDDDEDQGHVSEHSADEGSDSDPDESNAGPGGGRSTTTRARRTGAKDMDAGEDDEKARLLEQLQDELRSLTLEAETILSRQPRATQMALVRETKGLFDEYKHFGSMARLKVGVERFLGLGDERGKVRIEKEENEKQVGKDKVKNKTKEKEKEGAQQSPSKSTSAAAAAEAKRPAPAHYGEAFMLNDTEDDDKPKFDAERDFPTTRCVAVEDSEEWEEDNTDDLEGLEGLESFSDADDEDLDEPLHTHRPHPLRTNDPESLPYVTTLPWDPIATKISWADDKTWPPGLLGNLNKMLSVEDVAARERLFHHVSKYGPSPVFRVGIAEQLRHEYAHVFESAQSHYLGLTPETRSFLRGVYARHKHINVAERRLLALACRVAEDSVQMFWEDAADKMRGYEAMRIFMAARELERDHHAAAGKTTTTTTTTDPKPDPKMDPGSDARRAQILKAHQERFNREFRSGANANANAHASSDPNAGDAPL
ncbi:uncharacterized protein Z520_00100 [Fonsecaea multimorphosa CBS 102226]|uniref:Uncharacterized protein n=1 Tax=Fonsecaea multimorphosa CBS 102226 TaxID=1442371 RepID=A0A0D2L317_9EURO|nr:uncharacterized protein Z520_00100 [Fonsecaea multimorphosa CBS 102226]KIY03409.1 hypothetical protein Z520_00100 [Fonsecaea multimorphosa CBS 102226]OAL33058.1 hypothetical protein AYO22_00143 [Fonsecaea multimorphosa]